QLGAPATGPPFCETHLRLARWSGQVSEMEEAMKKLLFAAAATVALTAAVPAFAGGVGVRVGPGGVSGGDRDGDHWRYRDHGCRTVRERIETPSGRVIFKTRRSCD